MVQTPPARASSSTTTTTTLAGVSIEDRLTLLTSSLEHVEERRERVDRLRLQLQDPAVSANRQLKFAAERELRQAERECDLVAGFEACLLFEEATVLADAFDIQAPPKWSAEDDVKTQHRKLIDFYSTLSSLQEEEREKDKETEPQPQKRPTGGSRKRQLDDVEGEQGREDETEGGKPKKKRARRVSAVIKAEATIDAKKAVGGGYGSTLPPDLDQADEPDFCPSCDDVVLELTDATGCYVCPKCFRGFQHVTNIANQIAFREAPVSKSNKPTGNNYFVQQVYRMQGVSGGARSSNSAPPVFSKKVIDLIYEIMEQTGREPKDFTYAQFMLLLKNAKTQNKEISYKKSVPLYRLITGCNIPVLSTDELDMIFAMRDEFEPRAWELLREKEEGRKNCLNCSFSLETIANHCGLGEFARHVPKMSLQNQLRYRPIAARVLKEIDKSMPIVTVPPPTPAAARSFPREAREKEE